MFLAMSSPLSKSYVLLTLPKQYLDIPLKHKMFLAMSSPLSKSYVLLTLPEQYLDIPCAQDVPSHVLPFIKVLCPANLT